MTTAFAVWLTIGVLVLAVWTMRLALLGPILRGRQVLRSTSHDGPPESAPRVSVVVAAKDEQDNIETCVGTLLEQDYPNFEVIAVNDRSDDRTEEILRRIERQAGGRLHVITVKALRDGWFGKNNAMREGLAHASGEWILLTDADCRQISNRTISMAVREVVDEGVDFLSVTPVLETKTAWERVTQPVCALVLMLWFVPTRVNNPKKKTAYANGAFMLMNRRCYDAIGGHERVRTEVNEDIHMARFAKASGHRLRVMENDDLYLTRMYQSRRESWRGWSRIFYGSIGTAPRLMVAILAVIFFGLVPWTSLFAAIVGFGTAPVDAADPWGWAIALWGASIVAMQLVMWWLYPVLKIPRGWSFTYVFGLLVALGMLSNAMLKVLGATGTTWRGTRYRRNVREGAAEKDTAGNEVIAPPAKSTPVEEAVADG